MHLTGLNKMYYCNSEYTIIADEEQYGIVDSVSGSRIGIDEVGKIITSVAMSNDI